MMRRFLAGLVLLPLTLAILLLFPLAAFSASAGTNSTGTGADDSSVGTCTWSGLTNAGASDNTYVSCSTIGSTNITQSTIKIIKGGTITGTNKSTGAALSTADTYFTWGSTSDLWGTTWTPTDINASNFGVAISLTGSYQTTHYFKATNFGFSVPSTATIVGITADAEMSQVLTTVLDAQIDHVRLTVTYSMPNKQTITVVADGGVTSGWGAEGGDCTRLTSDDGDTTRLYTPTAGDIHTCTLTDTSGLAGATIHSLSVHIKVRSLDPVSNTVEIVARIAGTNYFSGDFDTIGTTTYTEFVKTWTTNPATGVAWTTSDIDAAEIGAKKINSVGMGWTYAYAEVDYTAAAGGGAAPVSDVKIISIF